MPSKLKLTMPLGGFNEAQSFENQPANSSPQLKNIVCFDPGSERFRIASRSGTGLFTYFNFNTGSTVSLPVPILPVTGSTEGTPIALPIISCQPFTLSGTMVTLDICGAVGATVTNGTTGAVVITPLLNADSTCGPISLILCSGPCNSTANCNGTLTLPPILFPPGSPPGSGGGTVIQHPPCPNPPCDPRKDPNRPWLACYECGHGPSGAPSFWVDESILDTFMDHTVPVLKNPANDKCYYVSAQRSKDKNVPAPGQGGGGFTPFKSCTVCLNGAKSCYTLYKVTFNCNTQSWSSVTVVWNKCLYPADVAAMFPDPDIAIVINTWFWYAEDYISNINVHTWYFVRETAGACTADNQCTNGAAPSPALPPLTVECNCPAYSGDPFPADLYADMAALKGNVGCASCQQDAGHSLTEWDGHMVAQHNPLPSGDAVQWCSPEASRRIDDTVLYFTCAATVVCDSEFDLHKHAYYFSLQCPNGGIFYAAKKFEKGSVSPAGVYQTISTGNGNCPGGSPTAFHIWDAPP